jgi:hypothetical protein
VDQVHTLLIKLGRPFHAPFDRLRGWTQESDGREKTTRIGGTEAL